MCQIWKINFYKLLDFELEELQHLNQNLYTVPDYESKKVKHVR